jgi:hypothetical protein
MTIKKILILFVLNLLLGCTRSKQEEQQSLVNFFDDCCYVAFLDYSDVEPIRDGFTFTSENLKILGDSTLGRKAIASLPTEIKDESQVDVFAYSFGLHILLDASKTPKYIIHTSSPPYVKISKLNSDTERWIYMSNSKIIAFDYCPKYYRTISEILQSHLNDPIAKDALNDYLK